MLQPVYRPCIVFIDEIDTIGKKRDGSGFAGNDEREQTLDRLLSEMDCFDGSSGVVILAATNRPETLDKALLRPGRFGRRMPAEQPDRQGREDILRENMDKLHELAKFLPEKETITGDEFMGILNAQGPAAETENDS